MCSACGLKALPVLAVGGLNAVTESFFSILLAGGVSMYCSTERVCLYDLFAKHGRISFRLQWEYVLLRLLRGNKSQRLEAQYESVSIYRKPLATWM